MFYTRCNYVGQLTKDEKRMHGRGIFTFSDGTKYVGTFHDGTFHGEGIFFYPESKGGGQYRGTWRDGRCLGGQFVFSDGLRFDMDGWPHCTADLDRRMWAEYLNFIAPPTCAPQGKPELSITPDYSTTNGIPPAFSKGKPRGLEDVSDMFWCNTPQPPPEHSFKHEVKEHKEESEEPGAAERGYQMATLIAVANGAQNRDAENPKVAAGRPPVKERKRVQPIGLEGEGLMGLEDPATLAAL